MASKENHSTTASASASRPMSLAPPNPRQSNGRQHSHSVSLGAVNVNHRVTRRKSVTTTSAAASNAAAVAAAAALTDTANPGTSPATTATTSHHRRGLSSRRGTESTSMGTSTSFGSFMTRNGAAAGSERKNSMSQNTAVDGTTTAKPVSTKNRGRRASEGSHLIKGEGKRSATELKCDRCGKGYKHGSCLTKHMWEHDPAWAYTSKLLISKHQQVQLLEAASVLVNMNQEPEPSPGAPEASRLDNSDRSSASPTASGISELRNGVSSTETTPPPMGDEMAFSAKSREIHRPNNNTGASAFSHSFQSMPSNSLTSSISSYSPAHAHFRQSSTGTRPSTADTGNLDDDAAGLAAAVELCNFGTPRTKPVAASADVPPVPPLPAQYLGQSMNASTNFPVNNSTRPADIPGAPHSFDVRSTAPRTDSSTPTTSAAFNALTMHSQPSYRISDERDVKMDDIKEFHHDAKQKLPHDDDFGSRSSVMEMDEDEDGVFGKMEE